MTSSPASALTETSILYTDAHKDIQIDTQTDTRMDRQADSSTVKHIYNKL